MTATSLTTLRDFLVSRYDELKAQLTRRLGNADMADDALQDTWVQLQGKDDRGMEPGEVRSPAAYILRMASNRAIDDHRAQSRMQWVGEMDSLPDAPHMGPGPARIAEGRSQWAELTRIIETMPARRRQILLAARIDGIPQYEIASRLGISLRLVERELQKAHEYCAENIKK